MGEVAHKDCGMSEREKTGGQIQRSRSHVGFDMPHGRDAGDGGNPES